MKIGILISGRGSNMAAIIDAVNSGDIPDATVAVVISDKSSAAGLSYAESKGVPALVIERHGRSREDHDKELVSALQKHGVDLVCLAGYMRLLSPYFVQIYRERILNIHPSLLPSFPGLNAQRQALDHGVKVSGCTVHYVNEQLDAGAIIVQKYVEIAPDETVESLSEKILDLEHQAYLDAINKVAGLIANENRDFDAASVRA